MDKTDRDAPRNPLLTIAIPTFNGGGTLKRTLESIVAQLVPGVDLLISDNASTDDTPAIVRGFADRFPQVSYRRNEENIGADRNFDAAITNSTGRFVWLFSDDDIMEDNAIAKLLGVLSLNPMLGAVFVNYATYTAAEVLLNARAMDLTEDGLYNTGELFLEAVNIGPIFCSSNIIRRSLWELGDARRYYGSGWVHYAVITAVIGDVSSYVFADPMVRLISRATWDTQGQLFKLTITLATIINDLELYGYTDSLRRELLGKIAKPLPITALAAKRAGLAVTRALFADVRREFLTTYPRQALAALFILTLPNVAVKAAFRVYGTLRRGLLRR